MLGIGRFLLVGLGVLAAVIAFLSICGLVYKARPRTGLALAGVVIAAPASFLFVGVWAIAYLGPRVGALSMVLAYIVILVAWVVYVFRQDDRNP